MTRDEAENLARMLSLEDNFDGLAISGVRRLCNYVLNEVPVIERQLAEADWAIHYCDRYAGPFDNAVRSRWDTAMMQSASRHASRQRAATTDIAPTPLDDTHPASFWIPWLRERGDELFQKSFDAIADLIESLEALLAEARGAASRGANAFETLKLERQMRLDAQFALATARERALEDAKRAVSKAIFHEAPDQVSAGIEREALRAIDALAKSPATPTSTETNDG